VALNLAAHLPTGYHGPRWTVEELALLGTAPDAEVAAQLERPPGKYSFWMSTKIEPEARSRAGLCNPR
jgi:hypothetical protein